MPFTPDKPTPGFQPDKPAGSVSDPQFQNPQPGSVRAGKFQLPPGASQDYMQGAKQDIASALPYVGGALGAVVGGIPGAGIGAGAGSMAKNLLSGDTTPAGQAITNVGKDAIYAGILPEVGGKLLGKPLAKAGDYLMQQAVGLKKYIPGVGTQLANEGVIGTRGMMANQVQQGLERRGTEIGNLAGSLEGVSSDVAGQRILNRANKLVQADGYVHPNDESEYQSLIKLADSITERGGAEGEVSGSVAASARAASGRQARQAGAYRLTNPAEGMKAGAASAEQSGWSQALKDSYAKAHPENPTAMAEADQAYGALATANKALSTPESIPQSFGGFLHKQLPVLPLGSSVAGRAANLGGNVMQNYAPNTVRSLEDLLGSKK